MGAVWVAASTVAGVLLGARFGYPAAFAGSVAAAVLGAAIAWGDGWPVAAWVATGAWITLQAGYFLGALLRTVFGRWRARR